MIRNDTRGAPPRRTDGLSLVFGLIFLGIAGTWAVQHFLDLHWNVDWDLPQLGWVVAAGLVLFGLLGILASLRRDRSEPPPTTYEPASRPTGAPWRTDGPPADDETPEPVDPVRGTERSE